MAWESRLGGAVSLMDPIAVLRPEKATDGFGDIEEAGRRARGEA